MVAGCFSNEGDFSFAGEAANDVWSPVSPSHWRSNQQPLLVSPSSEKSAKYLVTGEQKKNYSVKLKIKRKSHLRLCMTRSDKERI